MTVTIRRLQQLRSVILAQLPLACIFSSLAMAAPAPISVEQAPYSQLFFTGSNYAVKDYDYDPKNPSIGVETVWSANPTSRRFQVDVRYCVPNSSLTNSPTGAELTRIVLLTDQPFVTLNQRVAYTPTIARIVRRAQYDYPALSDFSDPFLLRTDSFGNTIPNNFALSRDNVPTAYVPESTCSYGTARFDATSVAATIAQAPAKTLQMQLVFSNDAAETWHLGGKTVQALKKLVQQNPTR